MALLPNAKVAARTALANYLRTNMSAAWPNLVVSENWPTPQRAMPPQAITVITPTTAGRTEMHSPVVWKVTPTSGVLANVLYSYGILEVDLQIDIWAQYEAIRDDLLATVAPLLNQNVEISLGTAPFAELPLAPGLVLPLTTYYSINSSYQFSYAPSPYETSDAALSGEWRASFAGTATMSVMDQVTTSMMTDIGLVSSYNGETNVTAHLPFLYVTTQNLLLSRPSTYTFKAYQDIGGTLTDVTGLCTWSSNSSAMVLSSGATFTTGASAGSAVITATLTSLSAATSNVTVL